jgi:hypothetical protein
MQGNDVQSNDVWRWRPDAVSSLDPRGGGEALIVRQVGRRSCGAKAAVRRDELGGGTHGELPLRRVSGLHSPSVSLASSPWSCCAKGRRP